MCLSYYYSFSAPANTRAGALKEFLKGVEKEAQKMGFNPTMVLDAPFDTPERKQFARRLTTGLLINDERLKGAVLPADSRIWEHDRKLGTAHVLPTQGVVIVVTDEQKLETIFGFFRYPETVKDIDGRVVGETHLADRWQFCDFVDSPDPRFRQIVRLFADAGFLDSETDEFHAGAFAR
jgi:hypothetical protein